MPYPYRQWRITPWNLWLLINSQYYGIVLICSFAQVTGLPVDLCQFTRCYVCLADRLTCLHPRNICLTSCFTTSLFLWPFAICQVFLDLYSVLFSYISIIFSSPRFSPLQNTRMWDLFFFPDFKKRGSGLLWWETTPKPSCCWCCSHRSWHVLHLPCTENVFILSTTPHFFGWEGMPYICNVLQTTCKVDRFPNNYHYL